jgi:hypothetical protein
MTEINLLNSKEKDRDLAMDLKSRIRELDRKNIRPKVATVSLSKKQMEQLEDFSGAYKYNDSIVYAESSFKKQKKVLNIDSYMMYGWMLHMAII